MKATHDAKMGIGTGDPRGRLHEAGVDARSQPLVVDGIVPGIYLNDTEGATATGARYDSFTIEADGNTLYIGSKDKANSRTPGSGTRNFLIRNDGQTVIKHKDTLVMRLRSITATLADTSFNPTGPVRVGHTMCFSAPTTLYGESEWTRDFFAESRLFDGRMGPDYPGGTPTHDNPQVITIEGLRQPYPGGYLGRVDNAVLALKTIQG